MPSSMTAFASNSAVFSWGSATWEIRSVNHRYLETFFRLPETVRDLEIPLRELTRKNLHRGKLDSSLQLQLTSNNDHIGVNLTLAKKYIDAAEQISGLMKTEAHISPLEIMRIPGILEEAQADTQTMKADLSTLFHSTLNILLADRAREGEKLGSIISSRIDAIDQHTHKINQLMPDIIAAQQQKITDKLAALKVDLNTDRVEQELVLIAQKADVDEELDRLVTHTEEIRKTLAQKGAIGRRLDFLMQELNREANTLGSKSIATISSQTSIDLKVLIEQMREQIQNIE